MRDLERRKLSEQEMSRLRRGLVYIGSKPALELRDELLEAVAVVILRRKIPLARE